MGKIKWGITFVILIVLSVAFIIWEKKTLGTIHTKSVLIVPIGFFGYVIGNMIQEQEKLSRIKRLKKEGDMLESIDVKHRDGWLLHRGWSCELQFFVEKIVVFREDMSLTIPLECIKKVAWTTDSEMDKVYITAQGEIEGGMVFDCVEDLQEELKYGALKREPERIFLVIYQKERNYHLIAFDVMKKWKVVQEITQQYWML